MATDTFQKILEQQKYVQSVKKFTHLKYPGDRLTSVIVPVGFTLVATALLVSDGSVLLSDNIFQRSLFFLSSFLGKRSF